MTKQGFRRVGSGCIAAAVAWACGPLSAQAQVNWLAVTTRDVDHRNPANLFTDSGVGGVDNPNLPLLDGRILSSFTYTVDFWTVALAFGGDGSDTVDMIGFRPFDVGPLPVLWQSLLLVDGKIVNGGGDAVNPLTAWSFQAWVEEDFNNVPFDGFLVEGTQADNINGMMVGNGLALIDDESASDSVLLAVNDFLPMQYFLVFHAVVPIASISVPVQLPYMAVTGEFGGPVFDGMLVGGAWIPVPEPVSLSLLGVSWAAAARFRRGRSRFLRRTGR